MDIPSNKEVLVWSIIATVVCELITVICRFGLKLESSHDTAFLARFTGGIRIHHGYVGLLVIVVALLCLKAWPALSRWALVGGIALFASDLIHHFLVLWPIVGSPEFHLRYPKP